MQGGVPWTVGTEEIDKNNFRVEITGWKDGRLKKGWSSHRGSLETNPTRIREDAGSIPGLAQWVKGPALR